MKLLLAYEPGPHEWATIRQTWPEWVDIQLRRDLDAESLNASLPTFDVAVGPMSALDKIAGSLRRGQVEWIERASALRLIHTMGHGIDVLERPEIRALLAERAITVARSNPSAITIAEFAIMNMVALSRRLLLMHSKLSTYGDWSVRLKADRASGSLGGELYGSTLGLIGYGSINQEIHRRAVAFGMRVGAVTARQHADKHGLDFAYVVPEIDRALAMCDYVVLGLPLTSESRSLFEEQRFAAMKPGSYLVNVSRGAIVDERALYAALRSGRLAGAALDVWAVEEEGGTPAYGYPSSYPFHQFNVIMTPHYSSATVEARVRAISTVGENLRRLAEGRELRNVVDLR